MSLWNSTWRKFSSSVKHNFASLCDCNWTRTHNHLVHKRFTLKRVRDMTITYSRIIIFYTAVANDVLAVLKNFILQFQQYPLYGSKLSLFSFFLGFIVLCTRWDCICDSVIKCLLNIFIFQFMCNRKNIYTRKKNQMFNCLSLK